MLQHLYSEFFSVGRYAQEPASGFCPCIRLSLHPFSRSVKVEGACTKKAEEIMMRSWKRGVGVITFGKFTIRVAPPLVITKDLVDPVLDIIIDTMKETEKESKP